MKIEKIRLFLKSNWPYIIMLVFILGISTYVLTTKKTSELKPGEKTGESRIDSRDQTKFHQRQKKLEMLVTENPSLYRKLLFAELAVFLVFFLGIFLDAVIIYKRKKGEPLLRETIKRGPVKWSIQDVLKLAIMFISFAYIYGFLEHEFTKLFPDFGKGNSRFVINAMIGDVVGIFFVINVVVFKYHENLETIGITTKNFLKNVWYGIAGYVALLPLLSVILILTGLFIAFFKLSPPVQPIVDMMFKEDKVPLLIYSSIFAAIAGPIMEEIFFRGFMYNAIKKRVGILWGVIITSLVFSLLHAHAVGFLPILALGILLAYLYEKTGSLIPSMTVHIIHNLGSLCVVFAVKSAGIN